MDASLACASGHSFDIAREGYVNLLPSHHRRSARAGDDGEMIAARQRFLAAGHYDPLLAALGAALDGVGAIEGLLDVGCGEGFFTSRLRRGRTAGIDISRPAIRLAARACADVAFAVASAVRLPLADATFDAALVVLAPWYADIERVLAPGGTLLRVSPGPGHLRELKTLVYGDARAHERATLELGTLAHVDETQVSFTMELDAGARADLLAMTPIRHRSSAEQRARALAAGGLAVTAEFRIDRFRRGGGAGALE